MSRFELRMQEASRQLFEMVEAELSEEEIVEEGVPPEPQTSSIPVRLNDSFRCYCHEIDWLTPLKNGGTTTYNYTDGTPYIQCIPTLGHGISCGDKVNLRQIRVDQAVAQCRYYSWDDPNTRMPKDLIYFFRKWDQHHQYDSRFDINHPDHYLNNYSSLEDLINHLKEPNLFPFSPILGTNSHDDAQRDIEEIEILKQLNST